VPPPRPPINPVDPCTRPKAESAGESAGLVEPHRDGIGATQCGAGRRGSFRGALIGMRLSRDLLERPSERAGALPVAITVAPRSSFQRACTGSLEPTGTRAAPDAESGGVHRLFLPRGGATGGAGSSHRKRRAVKKPKAFRRRGTASSDPMKPPPLTPPPPTFQRSAQTIDLSMLRRRSRAPRPPISRALKRWPAR